MVAMLVARPICARCRLKLITAASSHLAVRQSSTATSANLVPDDRPDLSSQSRSGPLHEPSPRLTIHKPNHLGSEQSRKWEPKKKESRQRILDLFERTVTETASAESEGGTPGRDSEQIILGRLHSYAEALRAMIQTKTGSPDVVAAECFSLVKDKIIPQTLLLQGPIPKVLHKAIPKAVGHAADLKMRNPGSGTISTTDICKAWADLGDLKAPRRLALALALLKWLIESRESKVGLAYQNELLEELVAFWKHFSALRRVSVGLAEGDPKFNLPALKDLDGPTTTLQSLFPQYRASESGELLPAIIATFVLLSDAENGMTKARELAEPLLLAAKPLIERLDKPKLEEVFAQYPELGEYVLPRATWKVNRTPPETQAPQVVKLEISRQVRQQPQTYFSYAAWHKRFSAAIRTQGIAKINAVWNDLVSPTQSSENRTRDLRNNPELFDFALFAYCSKHAAPADESSKSTVQVIEFMKSIGVEPTVRTFTAMIQGWKKAKQLVPIQHLWSQIVQSNMKLDKEIWTSKIAAESALGGPTAGIKALQEMSAMWKQAVQEGTQSKAVKPAIVCVNACVSGLLQRDELDKVQHILAWASRERIEPDVFTYNMLVGKMLKKGLGGEVDKLLQMMQKQGIAPDGASFTIILESAMEELEDQSPEEQRETVEKVFREMDTCGIVPNQEIYAKMLHVLMPAGDAPIRAVMAHLRRSGKQPTTQMCTILAQHYFSLNPPDLDAVKSLVADRRVKTRDLTDRGFWEMVMKGYAECGDPGSALEIFYDLDDWAIWPTLPPLEPVLRALIQRKEWEAAKKLVQTVRQQSRPQVKGRQVKEPDARYWKHAFWAIAADCHLLEDD